MQNSKMRSLIFITFLASFSLSFAEQEVINLSAGKPPFILTCGDVSRLGVNDTLEWVYVNASDISSDLDTTLSINLTDTTATGVYTCSVNGVEKSSYVAATLSPAHIKNTGKSVTYNDGDTNRKITCESKGSYPDPVFTWTKKGDLEGEVEMLVTSDDTNIVITTNGTESVLMFHNVTYDYAKVFKCTAVNAAGNSSIEIRVRVKNKYAAVWPFIGIVTEVVILIAIIFLYERHSKKAESKRDVVDDNADDQKPLNRDEGMEVRNRNGSK